MLGRGVEGNETVRKWGWAGVQAKEPGAKVLCRPGLFMELKLKAWQAVQMRHQPKGERGRARVEGNRLEKGNTGPGRGLKEKLVDRATGCFGYWNVVVGTVNAESNSLLSC